MKQILYVEDDEDTFNAVKVLPDTQGYKVNGAVNDKEALKLIEKESHDLILLDIMLPDMSGWDIFQKIHKSTRPLSICTHRRDSAAKSLNRVPSAHIRNR